MNKLKILMTGLMFFTFSIFLTGCGDLVEIQERDFVMALGISYESGQYVVTFSLPDLGLLTDQPAREPESLLRTYEGKSLYEVEQEYNANSKNRLDYRHLQSIILESSVCEEEEAMQNLLVQINNNYDISHNVLIYFSESGVEELMGLAGIDGSIGEYLKKLNNNNYVEGMEPAKVGELINCISNERTLFIPAIVSRDDTIAVDGGIFFWENQMVKQISQMESQYYFISLGKSNEYLLRLEPDHLVRLQEIKAKLTYELEGGKPVALLHITGTAGVLPGNGEDSQVQGQLFNEHIGIKIQKQLQKYMKEEGIDYLNLYEKSSYHSRKVWRLYENRPSDFIKDVKVCITVEIHYEE